MKVVLGILFLSFKNADFQFSGGEPTWRSYIFAGALPKARRIELIDKHKLPIAALGQNSETFFLHMAALEASEPVISIHPFRALLLAALLQDKASTEIPSEYTYYADVFLFDLAMELPEKTGINEYAIELV